MLLRLRIQGFKNLLDVDLKFGPFTCLAGRNGVGKSNVLDAIRFLNLLSRCPIMEACERIRGQLPMARDPAHLFACFGTWRAREIRFTADMIVPEQVEDDFGVITEPATTALRYTLALQLDDSQRASRLYIAEESLEPLGVKHTRRSLGFPSKPTFRRVITGRRSVPFISTHTVGGQQAIRVHQEGHGDRRFPAARASRTALGGLADSEFPSILAANREMGRWCVRLQEPSALREPSSYRDPEILDPRGGNLPAVLSRLARADTREGATAEALTHALKRLGEEVEAVRLVDDPARQLIHVEVRSGDGVFRPAHALSDATLRFLGISALSLDTQGGGMVCLEQPDCGVHPERIAALVGLLREAAVDPRRLVNATNPLRQVLLSTHSPRLVRQVEHDDLIFIDRREVELGGGAAGIGGPRGPEGSWRDEERNAPAEAPPVEEPEAMVAEFDAEGADLGDQIRLPLALGEA